MAFNVGIVSVNVGAISNFTHLLFPAPSDAEGGGITILGAWVVSGTTTSSVELVKMSSAGTPAVNGTIGAAVGGTADAFTAECPKPMTISSTYQFVDAGEWVAVKEGDVQAMDGSAIVAVQYVMGK